VSLTAHIAITGEQAGAGLGLTLTARQRRQLDIGNKEDYREDHFPKEPRGEEIFKDSGLGVGLKNASTETYLFSITGRKKKMSGKLL
jgi:hypothetical protein